MNQKHQYNVVALGGTFDHLHDGHKDFLSFASKIGKSLIIGVTDQHMTLQKPFAELIQPTHVRKQAILKFCNKNNIPAKVITLLDPYGPTIEENDIEAVACTTQTQKGADKINEIRSKLFFKELPIHIHQLKKDSMGTGVISAERVRAGEIDRTGTVYASAFLIDYKLSQIGRIYFSELHRKIVSHPSESKSKKTIRVVVGDSTLEAFLANKWEYTLGIFDRKQQRKVVISKNLDSLLDVTETKNKPGYIESNAVKIMKNCLETQSYKHIFVEGEEDLLAVAAILLLPLGSYVYYGQPSVGIVECLVTENLKETFYAVINQK